MEKEKVSTEQKQEKSSLYKLGIGLLILSLSMWLIPIITPFTPLPTKVKAVTITVSIIIAEVMFWIGALLVGKEVAAKFKSYLKPKNWRKNSELQRREKYSKSDQSND
ncbi:MAG: transporter suffix domain-containing protein [Psychrobacillus psychrodurans]